MSFTYTEKNYFWVLRVSIPSWKPSPNRVAIGLSQIAFPIIVLPKDDHKDFAQEEPLGLPYWTMILAICVVVDESKCLDFPIWEFSIIREHLPFSLGYELILRLLLVHRNLATWRWSLVFFGLLVGSPVRSLRRTQGRTPFHLCAVLPRPASRTHPLPATPFQCPRSRTATLGEGGAATCLPLRWPDCTLSRPAGDPVDSDPGAVFEDDPHPRSDAGRPLEPWVCHHTREPTVLSRLSCRPPHLNFDRFHQPCLFP